MKKYQIKCNKCGHGWNAKTETPIYCPKCNKRINYVKKYVKTFSNQRIGISDKTYSMLLRRKKSPDELLSTVIEKLINDNKYSETVRYKEEEITRQVCLSPELKNDIFELMNKYNIRTPNEVIWRLL